jgi:hypothetical protein
MNYAVLEAYDKLRDYMMTECPIEDIIIIKDIMESLTKGMSYSELQYLLDMYTIRK